MKYIKVKDINLNKKYDYHIHGEFSGDSKQNFDSLIQKAIDCNYEEIAITEHYDLTALELYRFGLLPLDIYYNRIQELRKKFPQIIIKFGLEIGEMHHSQKLIDQLFEFQKPDIIIGSIHILPDNSGVSLPTENVISDERIMTYYQENLKLVTSCQFDILGHLGIFRRFQKEAFDDTKFLPIIKEIFKTIIKKEIALEVNYSPLRNPLNNVLPEPKHLKLYKELGGKLLTIGSDAHELIQFDDYYIKAVEIIKKIGFSKICIKKDSKWHLKNI